MAALLLLFITTQVLLSTPVSSCSPLSSSSSSSSSSPNNDNGYCCDWCPSPSTASLLPPADDLINGGDDGGACGYGATVATGGGGGLIGVAAGAEFFRDGAGYGDCYQLRCRDRSVCGDDAGGLIKVVVADAANRTGFLLPREAFAAMATRRRRRGMSSSDDELSGGLLDDNVQVDFRRVPCEYKRNLAVQVVDDPGSRTRRWQLAIRFLYQGGQTDIAAVEIAQLQVVAGSGGTTPPQPWRPMSKARVRGTGVLWRSGGAQPPAGPLQLRLVVTAGLGGKWLRAERAVLPADWRPGEVHDTGIRVTDVALRTCARACRAAARDGIGSEEELR